jgi:hypothetical protein
LIVAAASMARPARTVRAWPATQVADYVRFATHYGFRLDFCHANDPESKGIVENLVGYSKRDLMIPEQAESGEPVGGDHGRCGVVRTGQHRGAFGDLRGPCRTARAGTPAAGVSCGVRSRLLMCGPSADLDKYS